MTAADDVLGQLSEAEMAQAVYRSDRAYDGVFFFGVTTTGIFCFPSCPARKPRREHIVFFRTREEALAGGFRPCRRCRPDLEQGRYSYERDLVERVKGIVDRDLESASVRGVADAVALDPHYLMRLFRRVTGGTIGDYIRRRRTERAAEILKASRSTVFDVALSVGFSSTSAFYEAFRRTVGVAPGQYRADVPVEEHRHGVN